MNARRRIPTLPLALAVALALALAACRTGARAGGPERIPAAAMPSAGDPEVEGALELREVATTVAGGRRTVAFRLVNASARSLRFAYRIEWHDARGAPLAGVGPDWTRQALAAGASVPVEATAPAGAGASWRLAAVADPPRR